MTQVGVRSTLTHHGRPLANCIVGSTYSAFRYGYQKYAHKHLTCASPRLSPAISSPALLRRHGAAPSSRRRCAPRPASAAYSPATESIDEESSAAMAKLLATFHAADANGDGVLQRDELRSVLESVGDGTEAVPMRWVTDEDLDKVIKQYDANRDGVISFDEFTRLAQDKVFLTRALADYRAAFNAIDTGRNGTVSPTELYNLFVKLDSPLKDYERIVRLMDKYDTDNNGQIDFGEFLRLCRDEDALPLAEIMAYAGMPATSSPDVPPAAVPPPPPSDSVAAPGTVTTFFCKADFEAALAAHPDKLVVVLASLTWCRPCKKVVPALEKMAAAYPGAVILKFFGNSNDDTKALFKDTLKVRVTPAFFFFRAGKLVGACTGANAPRLEGNLRSLIGPGGGPAEPLYPPPVEDAAAAAPPVPPAAAVQAA